MGEKTPKTSPKRNLLDYTATTKGLSSLWTTMIKNKTPQKFDLMTNAIDGSLAKADTRLQAFPFHKLELFRPSKPCPIVRMFGGELSVSVHPRIKRRNNGTHNICPRVSKRSLFTLRHVQYQRRPANIAILNGKNYKKLPINSQLKLFQNRIKLSKEFTHQSMI